MTALDSFAAFWQNYPPRNGVKAEKKAAMNWWLRHKPDDGEVLQIMQGLARYKRTDQWKRGFVPDAIRFLSHRRWEDEIGEEPPPDRSVGAVQADAMEQRAREVIEGHKAAEHTASPMPAQLRKLFGGRREE